MFATSLIVSCWVGAFPPSPSGSLNAYWTDGWIPAVSTKERIVNDNTKDTPITVTLKAYAKENPEKVFVIRNAVFIYPRADKLK